ncbi:hypothetical protein ACFQ6V_13125 [Streptomyces roseifaciens]
MREHTGVEIVCRDRAAFFAEGARAGAPQAQHCADKWYVWHNLGEAVERLISHHCSPARPRRTGTFARIRTRPGARPRPRRSGATRTLPAGEFPQPAPRHPCRGRAQVEQVLSLREVARRFGPGRTTVRPPAEIKWSTRKEEATVKMQLKYVATWAPWPTPPPTALPHLATDPRHRHNL